MVVMWQILGVIGFVWLACFLSWKLGAREEQIKKLNQLAEEQKKANEVMDNVRNASIDSVRERLQNIRND